MLVRDPAQALMIVRGAPEEVLRISSVPEPDQRALADWLSLKGRAGERTIAIAKRVLPPGTTGISPEDERDLEFLGAIAFTDPIKPSAYRAVEKAKELGVSIKIITGDNCEVAGAVGVQIGLLDDPTHVISGSALMAMPPDKRGQAVVEHAVIARVTPEQKYEIIRLLQGSFTVGFLGEGINDAPALKLAGVSLAVDSAAGIAREAADIILLQKNLEVIIEGIRERKSGVCKHHQVPEGYPCIQFREFLCHRHRVAVYQFLTDAAAPDPAAEPAVRFPHDLDRDRQC